MPNTHPSARAAVAALPDALPSTGGTRGEYALADVARPLGILHLSIRTIIDTLRALAKHEGMPLPRTPRVIKGKPVSGVDMICKISRWNAGEYDAWLDGRGRGPASPAPAMLPPPLRQEMAARAVAIGAGR
ncbi:hypothetical protein [Sphingomonas alpina]|uniref:Uncharacterized protein n=1 Tax=Sphingomonas alpina TaxID=653931 RepID=A0A7H0LHX8_9SPHN|nr:hypothetical protein [Sphingomonas alpina]QNQ09281.1 hypothetical protein H3Z74_21845 [Sphingomonas alpina]